MGWFVERVLVPIAFSSSTGSAIVIAMGALLILTSLTL